MISVVEEIYLEPLKDMLRRLEVLLAAEGTLRKDIGDDVSEVTLKDIQLLNERLSVCTA